MTGLLYDYALSGNCYKIRLMAALLGVRVDTKSVDFYPGNEHRSLPFLALNPAGTLPVFAEGDLVLTESAAILTYLAQNHDPKGNWFPTQDPGRLAKVQQWLSFSGRLTATAGEARLGAMLNKPVDMDKARDGARSALREMEAALTDQKLLGCAFLTGATPTIADIACFPYAALAADGGIELDPYPALRDWIFSVRTLPGFIEMPGIHAVHEILTTEEPA
ncbi:glutathione S-transferase family protein [Qingshengfaniella alkalisoli]|uniref:Glutathione S-transferase family protein n=1 Tax=Qingshengfaniella alkalisoli TaxID=2599296 RepID=A0A5B8JA29_9RHOB|nr:glutathione S-transferase family protein [Qingshengfaniella alkalisoli]QDY71070.1 glutathione S-transferase family protein [Qingshengfaniella alkalisoli]